MSYDLSAIRGDTTTFTLPVLRTWATTLAELAEEGDQFVTLANYTDVVVGDTLTIGTESRVITVIGEGVAAFADPLLFDHLPGVIVTGVGPVDLDTAAVVFSIARLDITKDVTVADPETGAAIVVLDPADTEDVGGWDGSYWGWPWRRYGPSTHRWQLRATYESGTVRTLGRGLFLLWPDVR